jgi:hypothetical protein
MSLSALTARGFLFLDARASFFLDAEVFDDEAAAGRLRLAGFLPSDLAAEPVFLVAAISTPFR